MEVSRGIIEDVPILLRINKLKPENFIKTVLHWILNWSYTELKSVMSVSKFYDKI